MAAPVFKRDEIILLLGAGASVEAGIPDSSKMVQKIEELVSDDDNRDWSGFRDLYRYVRSAIFYADGLDGIFGDKVPFNIERLVNVLDELSKKERHTLYPFVGAWNPKLQDVAGSNFEKVGAFRSEIIRILRERWVALPEREKAAYYQGLLQFQEEYEHPLRVFSLNYDLCVEETCGYDKVQRGFSERAWDWRLLDETSGGPLRRNTGRAAEPLRPWRLFDETSGDPLPLLLYKLHGSLDWSFSADGRVSYSDSPSHIDPENMALIFGTSYKLQYVDPFLFLAYQLRRWTLDTARIIVCIGYGFNDDHINGILQQSLRQDRDRRLLAVLRPGNEEFACKEKQRLVKQLTAQEDQIIAKACGAKEFLGKYLNLEFLGSLFPPEEDLIGELEDPPEG